MSLPLIGGPWDGAAWPAVAEGHIEYSVGLNGNWILYQQNGGRWVYIGCLPEPQGVQ